MKFIPSFIIVLACLLGLSCENAPSKAKALQSQVPNTAIQQDTIPTKVDRPTKFDHPGLLGEWVINEVTGNDVATQKLYLLAQVSLGNDQRFKMTTTQKATQTGFWKASAKGDRMRWIIKDVGMVKFEIEKIETDQVTLRLSGLNDINAMLTLVRK